MDFTLKRKIDNLLQKRDVSNVCISLDWLSLYFSQNGFFKEKYEEGNTIEISPDCYLLEINRATLHFNTHFVLFYKKEECAHVLMNTKNELFFKKDIVKVDFSNHTLYSQQWIEIMKLLEGYGLKYNAASRIDIAIDGVEYLQQLMNIYAKQNTKNRTMRLKNSNTSRARFSAKVLNTDTMLFENFNIGSAGGNKMITIYNKSLEIVKSGKTYIQEYWLKNGLITRKIDIENLKKELDFREKKGYDTFHLKDQKNIYRFELRLKSESIKEIRDFAVEMLFTSAGLASIIKTHCKKYFEGCFNDNKNTTHCTGFDLLPYDRLNAKLVSKINRIEKDGVYKAKMTIHGLVQDIYKGYVQRENYNEIIETIIDRVAKYRLAEYVVRKLPEWHNKYLKFIDDERRNDVTIVINRIQQLNEDIYKDQTYLLAIMNNQARATGKFGEG